MAKIFYNNLGYYKILKFKNCPKMWKVCRVLCWDMFICVPTNDKVYLSNNAQFIAYYTKQIILYPNLFTTSY